MNKSGGTLENPSALLLGHAVELGKDIPSALNEILSFWPDVHHQIKDGIEAARHLKTKTLLGEIQDQHEQVIASSKQLTDENARLLAMYKCADLEPRIREILNLVRAVDPAKLADEELLKNCHRSREIVLATPDQWAFLIAASQIPLYVLTYFYKGALAAFLGRPGVGAVAWSATKELLVAAAKDLAGNLIPFLGVIETTLELTVPQLEKELERMRHAVELVDRLFVLEDGLSMLRSLAAHAQGVITLATVEAENGNREFQKEAAWLAGVLKGAGVAPA